MTDWKEVDTKSKLIKLDTKGNIIVPTFGECVANNKLFYVQEGLKRFEYYGSENFNEIYNNIRVLPIISDPTSPDGDGDGDGILDAKDPKPLSKFDDRFMITDNYNNEPPFPADYLNEKKLYSDKCYGIRGIGGAEYDSKIFFDTYKQYIALNIIALCGFSYLSQLIKDYNGERKLAPMPNTAVALLHFIHGSGETYKINNLDECIALTYTGRKCYYDNMNALLSVCEDTVSPQNNLILTSTDSNNMMATKFDFDYPTYMPKIPFEEVFEYDWHNTVGGSRAGMVCSTTCDNSGNYTMKVKYYLFDNYNWDWHTLGKDKSQHFMHECGFAQEYLTKGVYETEIKWTKGQRFDGSNSTLINNKQFEGIIIYSVTNLLNIFKRV